MDLTPPVRGFSNTYIPDKKLSEKKIDVMEFQFIEGSELEREWKQARRQRLKQQEERIWTEFVQDKADVLQTVLQEDKYQFIEEVPEECLKQLINNEIKKAKKETSEQDNSNVGAGDSPRQEKPGSGLTFSQASDEVFQIFDDDDDDEEKDDFNEENFNESLESPCTVREMDNRVAADDAGLADHDEKQQDERKPTEPEEAPNMVNMIESSIYCAKVKDLRSKIKAELIKMVSTLEMQNIGIMEAQQLRSMCLRAAEYAARFHRVHLYHLQRQVNDVKRHNSERLPFAKHTQFQSQMARIVALHHATLQALQVFHKSMESTGCVRECGEQLLAACANLRDGDAACRQTAAPPDFAAAAGLYDDDLQRTVEVVESAVKDYEARVAGYILSAENARVHTRKCARPALDKNRKRCWSRAATKDPSELEANAKLSMYSLETVRMRPRRHKPRAPPPAARARDSHAKDEGGAGKGAGAGSPARRDNKTPRSHRKTPRARRPLMRDPHQGKTPRPRAPDVEIQTMVEDVAPPSVSSPNLSERSPLNTPRRPRAPPPPPKVPPLKVPPPATPRLHTRRKSPGGGGGAAKGARGGSPPSPVIKVECSRREEPSTPRESPSTHVSRNQSARSFGSDQASARSAAASARSSARETKGGEGGDVSNNQVSRLLRQLCSGDSVGSGRSERQGAKNAQLHCVSSGSPRTPTTPQLLRILEETIQKKVPKAFYQQPKPRGDKLRLAFNIPQKIADNLFQYRTKFVQHMLASSMYANSAVGKPWEMIGSISERILDELIMKIAKEMELKTVINELYRSEIE